MNFMKKMLSLLCALALCVSAMLPLALAESTAPATLSTGTRAATDATEKPATDKPATDKPATDLPVATDKPASTKKPAAADFTPVPPATSVDVYYVTNAATGLYLMEKAGEGENLGLYANGTVVSVFSIKDGWAYVKVDGKYGYMNAKFLTTTPPTDSTKGPAATDATEKPAATDPTKSPAATDATDKPTATDPTKSPAATDATEKPATDKPATDRPATDLPVATDKPATDRPATDLPVATDKPATDRPATDLPVATDKPAAADFTPVPPATSADVYYVTGTEIGLNLRNAPVNGKILGLYANGTVVSVYSIKDGWATVRVNGQSGYMDARYLTRTAPITTPLPPATSADVYYVTGTEIGLNLRKVPVNGEILGRYPNETVVSVYSIKDGWATVSVNGQSGYMDARYLTRTAPAGAPTYKPANPTEKPADPTSAPAGNYESMTVKADSLALYASPKASAAVLSTYPAGTKVSVIFTTSTGWARVQVEGKLGYMQLSGLEKTEAKEDDKKDDDDKPSEIPATGTVKYITAENGKDVALRKEAKKGNNIIKFYPVKTKVICYSNDGTWSSISINGTKGYMMSEFLTDKDPDQKEPEVPAEPEVPEVKPEESTAPATGTVKYVTAENGKNVALRKEAKKGNNIINFYPVKTKVICYSNDGAWSYISIDGVKGYMMSEFLTDKAPNAETPAEKPTVIATKYVKTGNTGRLALRSSAKKANNLIGYYPNDTMVQVYAIENGWAHVLVEGKEGYMQASFLSDTPAQPEIPEEKPEEKPDESTSTKLPYPIIGYMYVKTGNTGRLALRTYAKKTNNLIGYYPNDTKVGIMKFIDDWAYVSVDGQPGYMMKKFLSDTPSANYNPEGDKADDTAKKDDVPAADTGKKDDAPVADTGKKDDAPVADTGKKDDAPAADTDKKDDAPAADTDKKNDAAVNTKTVTHPNGSYVNLRSSAADGSDANIIAKIPSGTKAEVLSVGKYFTKVSCDGKTGYINSNYLK